EEAEKSIRIDQEYGKRGSACDASASAGVDRIRASRRPPLRSFVSDPRKVLPQYVMPKRGLTAFAGHVASRDRGATTTRLVRWFVRKYGVDMSEAAIGDGAAARNLHLVV